MKKIIFIFFVALSVMLTSCQLFVSAPIEPKIIGTGNIQYEAKSDIWFVFVNQNQYTITKVTVPDNNPHSYGTTQDIEPVDGMLVTVFTSPHMTGVQAVTGRQSIEQIEELYKTNDTGFVLMFVLVWSSFLLALFFDKRKKSKQ